MASLPSLATVDMSIVPVIESTRLLSTAAPSERKRMAESFAPASYVRAKKKKVNHDYSQTQLNYRNNAIVRADVNNPTNTE